MISRIPPMMADSVRASAEDVIRTLYLAVESKGRDRDKGEQIE